MSESWNVDDAFLLGLPVVAPQELFFSITDRRGVIEQANSVFIRLSGFARSELIGAPHNIIRHPVMPAGVFRIMWDLLAAGHPVAAYTTNRSHDGRPYSVFATITPIGNRMLSVRSAPCDDGLRGTAETIYREVLELEHQAATEGRSRRTVAEYGATEIMRRLSAAGFASYEDFVRYAVPAEGQARVQLTPSHRTLPSAVGRLHELERTVATIDGELAALWHTLDRYQDLANQVAQSSAQVHEAVVGLTAAVRAVADASAQVADRAPVLERSARAMAGQATAVQDQISALGDELVRVEGWLRELRYRIALTRLHNDMVQAFIAELADGRGMDESRAALPELCATLEQDVTVLSADMSSVAQLLTDLGRHVEQGSEELRGLRRGLSAWRLMVPKYGVSRELDGWVGPVDQHLNQSHQQLEVLVALARQCTASAVPMDPTVLLQAITAVAEFAVQP